MLPASSSQSTPNQALFQVDLFAKAAAPPGLAQRQSAHPFLIVANSDGCEGYAYEATEVAAFFERLRGIDVLSQDGELVWVDVDLSTLGEGRYEQLCDWLQLHDVTRRDCIIEDTSVTDTKVSLFDMYLFLIVDTLVQKVGESSSSSKEWETRNLNIILHKRVCVTLHKGPIPGPASILHRIQDFHSGKLPTANWVQYTAFDVLVESLLPKIDAVCRDVEMIDQKSVPDNLDHNVTGDHTADKGRLLQDMRVARKRLGKLRSSLSSKMETLEYLLRQRYPSIFSSSSSSSSTSFSLYSSSSSSPFSSRNNSTSDSDRTDLFHHLCAIESEVKWKMARIMAAQETLHGAHQNYLAFVSVQAANINNQANSVLKRITLLLALTSPLNLIASIFGMNVYPLTTVVVKGSDAEDSILFVTLIIVMFLSSFFLLAAARWYRWL